MNHLLETLRHNFQGIWGESTVSPMYSPVDPAKPKSLGQCSPTSYVLIELLRNAFPDREFTLAAGQVLGPEGTIIPYHVWVVEIADSPKHNKVIDITADQTEVLPSIIYRSITDLIDDGIYYIAYQHSTQAAFLHEEAIQRGERLQSAYMEHYG